MQINQFSLLFPQGMSFDFLTCKFRDMIIPVVIIISIKGSVGQDQTYL
jgi:hypothetical protein